MPVPPSVLLDVALTAGDVDARHGEVRAEAVEPEHRRGEQDLRTDVPDSERAERIVLIIVDPGGSVPQLRGGWRRLDAPDGRRRTRRTTSSTSFAPPGIHASHSQPSTYLRTRPLSARSRRSTTGLDCARAVRLKPCAWTSGPWRSRPWPRIFTGISLRFASPAACSASSVTRVARLEAGLEVHQVDRAGCGCGRARTASTASCAGRAACASACGSASGRPRSASGPWRPSAEP